MYPSNADDAGPAATNAVSRVERRSLEHVANRAPPSKHMAPPPRANNAENHPVFRHTLLGSEDLAESK